ncbi:phage minor capsid protein [Micromonospora sp. KC213]|uniref:phage minor capsid protein n=1 Tax=Micromonospora sp. KC213 TaxID=2530378 RepID=UPI00104D427E|nr:phage minor capsid protein [Micromonospora sp. KC213]TDC42084.1 minor capsid protein [Micromonospora sp. KC213]
MPVPPEQIEDIARDAADLYREAETSILATVTRYLADGLDAPDWAVRRLGALSALRRAVERTLALVGAAGADRIRQAVADAYRSGRAAATVEVPRRYWPRDLDLAAAAAARAEVPRAAVIENLAAALIGDIGQTHSNVLRHVEDVYRTVIQRATAISVAAGQTRRQAAQHAYQRFVDQGVTSFTDVRGRRWRLSSYVEMGVRTVTQRAAVQGQTDRLQDLGVDLVLVSNSPRECPLCRPWEGKVLTIAGGRRGRVQVPSAVSNGTVTVDIAGSLAEARAAGLQHPNCTHSVRAYLPGATRIPTGNLANPDGYEAKERQREIERQIRKWKEREQAALDPAARTSAQAKVRAWQKVMREHLAAHPELKRLPYREQIGAGNLPPGPRPAAPPPPAPTPSPSPPPLPQRTRTTQPPARVADLPGLLAVDLGQSANRSMVRDVMADVIGGDYAGLTVEIEDVELYDEYGVDGDLPGILVRGGIYPDDDLNARQVGTVMRGFYRDEAGDLVAVHAYLQLDPSTRGKGFATEFNGRLETWYRSQGISRIEVHANIDVGGYTWASHGYDFADEESAESVLDRLRFIIDMVEDEVTDLREEAEQADDDEAARLGARADALDAQLVEAAAILDRADTAPFGSDAYPSAYEISQCGRSAATGNEWIGKRAMLGSDWQGVKWL